jgi:hypothetical protein
MAHGEDPDSIARKAAAFVVIAFLAFALFILWFSGAL